MAYHRVVMSRLPFDPSKMKGPKKAPEQPPGSPGGSTGGSGETPLTVSALASRIDDALSASLPKTVRVIGEISGFTDRTHLYFDLKDDESVVNCVMFAPSARKLDFTPASGQQVVAKGRIAFYNKQGRTQLYVTSMTPAGEGPLELELRRLVGELREKGYFDGAHKRSLPSFPRRVAVVTSATGAAFQDVRETMRRRMPGIEIVLCDVRVQGENAAPQIARTIRALSARRGSLGIDAIILTRGGGSLEDLWAFNEREVADAVYECELPIVAAIGHETDTTIAELVADERASTPTQAAVRLSPDRAALIEQVERHARQLARSASRHIADERTRLRHGDRQALGAVRSLISMEQVRLGRLDTRLTRARPEASHARRVARTETAESALRRAMRRRLDSTTTVSARASLERAARSFAERQQSRLDALERELVVTGPAAVLARGYSVTTRPDGSAVRSVADVTGGMTITTRVADGSFTSVTGDGARTDDAPRREQTPALPPRTRPRKKTGRARKKSDPNQLGLF